MKYSVIIVAAGKGKRAKLGYNKAFFILPDGKRVIDKSVDLFLNDQDCESVIVVLNEEDINNANLDKRVISVIGGRLRKDSVMNGLEKVDSEYVLIHDAARPYLSIEDLNNIKKELEINDACILARQAFETVKYVENGYITKTIDRNNIYLASTPQAFKTKLIKEAYEILKDEEFTDDASLLERLNKKVSIVVAKNDNPKLTFPEDFN